MFDFSEDHQFEATGDERQNVVIPNPAPRCKMATRKDTGDWHVASGVYFKPVTTDDGTNFRDVDGGWWRLITSERRARALIQETSE